MALLERYMNANKLKLNLTKTAIITIPPVVRPNTPTVTTLATPGGIIHSKKTMKILGVTFSDTMQWDSHVSQLVSQLTHKLTVMRTLARHANTKVLRQVAMAIIHSRINYCITVYGYLTQASMQRLQTIILAAARICLGPTFQRASTHQLLSNLQWQSLPQMVENASSKLIQQTLTTGVPESLHSRLDVPVAGATRAALRGAIRPTPRATLRRRRSLLHMGVATYNFLTLGAKTTARKAVFRGVMKQYIKQCKPYRIPNYAQIHLAEYTDRPPARSDLTYHIDDDGRLIRNLINLKEYNGKMR